MEALILSPKIPSQARATLKVFCWRASRDDFTANRFQRLASEFRKAGGRLTRPYEIPV
jgi:hypothetical protein